MSRPNRFGLSRRGFLGRIGAAAAVAPFVPWLEARADDGSPMRLVLLYTPHGTIRSNWLPTGTETAFTLGPILSPLARHQDKVVVLDGVGVDDTSVGAPHTKGSPLLWTASPLLEDNTFSRDDGMGVYYYGWNSAASIDQVIANQLAADVPYRSLELAVRPANNHPGHRLIYSGAAAPLAPEDDPYATFARLFGGGSTVGELQQLHAERRSVLDRVTRDLNRVQGRVPAADRAKIEAHLQAVRDIEHALDNLGVCEPPTVPTGLNPSRMSDVPELFRVQWDLLARALACDLTRVASMQFSVAENDQIIYDWLGVDYEVHHLITHSNTPAAAADLTAIYRWYAEQLAYFLDLLAAIPEGDGTVLDHTLVIWGSEIGRGWDHDFDNVPFVLAGGADGAWPTGRFLQFSGAKHNRLLVSAARAMGVDMDTFGGTDTGVGGLAGLL